MNQGLIPSRYAKALFEYASEHNADKSVFGLMETLAASFQAQPALLKATENPFVPAADKVALLLTAAGAGAGESEVYRRFLDLLVSNRRLDAARDIALAYLKLYRQRHDIRLVTVSSAAPLDPAEEKRLKDLIARHLGSATMDFRSRVNPDLIGGSTIDIDNEKLDASVAGELKQLRLSLLSK